jgi:hypothetical protein
MARTKHQTYTKVLGEWLYVSLLLADRRRQSAPGNVETNYARRRKK